MSTSEFQPLKERHGIGLCLSGGGFRASLFHLGVLRRLNEVGLLSQVRTVSSVSGGSITNAVLAKCWRALQKDPATGVFVNFDSAVESPLQDFCGRDLRTGVLVGSRVNPLHWGTLFSDDHSATDFLSHAYQDKLLGSLRLQDLKAIKDAGGPDFVFCASNLQTGVSFEFRSRGVGDWQIGWSPSPDTLVADAVAASSAFPLAFPPLILKANPGGFSGGELEKTQDVTDLRRRIVLSDGGVYDNLGLEPVWKSHLTVLCSDGGKPFDVERNPGSSSVPRLLRAQDVIGNQALAVRKRWLISSLEQGTYSGAYWGIGTDIAKYPKYGPGYRNDVLQRIRRVRTDLDSFTAGEQKVLMNHGWALTDAALRSHVPKELLRDPLPPGLPPDPALLADTGRAKAELESSDKTKVFGH